MRSRLAAESKQCRPNLRQRPCVQRSAVGRGDHDDPAETQGQLSRSSRGRGGGSWKRFGVAGSFVGLAVGRNWHGEPSGRDGGAQHQTAHRVHHEGEAKLVVHLRAVGSTGGGGVGGGGWRSGGGSWSRGSIGRRRRRCGSFAELRCSALHHVHEPLGNAVHVAARTVGVVDDVVTGAVSKPK